MPMGMNATRKQPIEELRRMVLSALGTHDAAVWLFGSCARGEVLQHRRRARSPMMSI